MPFNLAADPFTVLTIVAAPAVLTNSSSVLALGTSNRLARVSDRTHVTVAELAKLDPASKGYALLAEQLPVFETRGHLLLRALRFFYTALGLFASSTVIAIVGSIAGYYAGPVALHIAAGIGLVCGASAVVSMVCGSTLMIRETQLAVKAIGTQVKAHAA
jgi:uncharacterized membrane protein